MEKVHLFLCLAMTLVVMSSVGPVEARRHSAKSGRHAMKHVHSRLAELLNVEETDAEGFMETDEEIASLPTPKLDLTLPAFPELITEQEAPRNHNHAHHSQRRNNKVERDFEEVTPRFRSVHKAKKRPHTKRSHVKPRYYATSHAHPQQQQTQQPMRFMAQRFASQPTAATMMMGGGGGGASASTVPVPVTPAAVPQMDYFRPSDISQVNPIQMNDALFDPIPQSTQNGQPLPPSAPSLTSDMSNYIYAYAQPPQPYRYPVPPNIPLVVDNPVTPAFQPGAPSLLETQTNIAVGGGGAGSMARSPTLDLSQSGYQSYSQQNWPSSVAPPAAYYLPPDVVGI